mgnify:CR=1 FL=1
MKHLPLLLLAALGFAAEEAPRSPFRPEGPGPEGRPNPRLPVPLSPDEQKRLHEAMEKAKQDPAVKEAHEQAAKAQQAAMAKVLVPPPLARSDEILSESGGMFYSRETPAHEVYVREGDHFNAGDPLFIVEVMKMFNKVYAPFSGTIDKVLVDTDGTIIKKGQAIFKITPDEILVEESPEDIAARRKQATNQFLQQL